MPHKTVKTPTVLFGVCYIFDFMFGAAKMRELDPQREMRVVSAVTRFKS